MLLNWIKSVLRTDLSEARRAELHDVLDDDVSEIELLGIAQQAGEFAQLDRAELIAIAQRQARTIELQMSEISSIKSMPRKIIDKSQLLKNAGEQESDLAVANHTIVSLTKQLDQARVDRERDLRKFGKQKAEYELRLLGAGQSLERKP